MNAGHVRTLIRAYKKMIIFCSVWIGLLLHLCSQALSFVCLVSKISLEPPVLMTTVVPGNREHPLQEISLYGWSAIEARSPTESFYMLEFLKGNLVFLLIKDLIVIQQFILNNKSLKRSKMTLCDQK